MNTDKDIRTYNYKGQYHGYQKWYSQNNTNRLYYVGNRINNIPIGYVEWHINERSNYYIR